MKNPLINYWRQRESRERMMLGWGTLIVILLLFYAFIWQPWHTAIEHMQGAIQERRESLVWMRQQAELLKSGDVVSNKLTLKGSNQSILSILEQTAKLNNIRESIQQLVPGQDNHEVSVVLEQTDFNRWVAWIDILSKQYGVNIKQLSAERDNDLPNIAEIRVTFRRD